MKKLLNSLTALLVFAAPFVYAWQPQTMAVFGDSFSDNGNKYQLYNIPVSPPYWHGRYSNGLVWVENLAYQFNLIENPNRDPNYSRNMRFRDYAMGDSVAIAI